MIPLFGEHMERELFDSRMKGLTERFKEITEQCISIDIPVVFDYGFWKKSERDDIVLWAESLNASWEFFWIDTPKDECERRALNRNKLNDNAHFIMTKEMLDLFWSWFEIPDETELITRMCYSKGEKR